MLIGFLESPISQLSLSCFYLDFGPILWAPQGLQDCPLGLFWTKTKAKCLFGLIAYSSVLISFLLLIFYSFYFISFLFCSCSSCTAYYKLLKGQKFKLSLKSSTVVKISLKLAYLAFCKKVVFIKVYYFCCLSVSVKENYKNKIVVTIVLAWIRTLVSRV